MNNDYIVGIDLGSANIYGSIGKADEQGKLKILANSSVKSRGIRKGAIVNITSATEVIKECISELEAKADMYITDVYISIPSGICKLISSKGFVAISNDEKRINEGDVAKVLNGAKLVNLEDNECIIDIIPERYLIDDCCEVKNPIGINGSRLEVDVKVVIVDETIMNNIYDCFKNINVNIKGTMISAESTSKILLSEEDNEEDENIALIDVGEEKTDIAIYKHGKIAYVNSLPLGGKNVSSDIAYCLKLHEKDSEMLKLELQSTYKLDENISVVNRNNEQIIVDKDMVYEIIYARVEEILQFINNAVDNAIKDENVNTIIIYGGGVSCFQYIKEVWESISDKNLCIVDKKSINLENPLIINSLGIVKHVFNELKLNHIDYNNEENIQDDEEDITIEKNKGIMCKIKSFLNEYF